MEEILQRPTPYTHTKLAAPDGNQTDNPTGLLDVATASQSRQRVGTYKAADREFSGAEKAESLGELQTLRLPRSRSNERRRRQSAGRQGELSREGEHGRRIVLDTKEAEARLAQASNDVDYNSEESARDSSGDGEGLRPRKQQKLHASRKTSPPNRPILDLDSQLPYDGTGRNSGDEKHDNNDDHIEDERAVSTTQPASPSLQESTSLRDIEPLHDEVGNGSRNQILDYPVNDLTEEDDDSDDGDDDNDEDEENDEGYDKDEDKAKNYSDGSDGGDDDGDGDGDSSDGDEEGNKAHKHVEQHKPPTSVRGISNPKRAAEHGLQRSRHSPLTLSMRKSDRSTAPTSNHHKRVAPPKHGCRRARKPSFIDSASDSDGATSGAALNANLEGMVNPSSPQTQEERAIYHRISLRQPSSTPFTGQPCQAVPKAKAQVQVHGKGRRAAY